MTVAQEIIDRCQASMGALLDHRVDLTPDKEAFRYPDVDETWPSLTWRETRDRVHQYAAGLLSLGLGHEERVALASSTRIEWILVDLAVNCAAGATTAIYPNTTGDDFAHIITHSESRIFVAENAEQLAQLRANSELAAQVLTPSGTDPDEMYLLGMRVEISDIVAGDGFTVTVYSEAEASGTYTVMVVGTV